MAAPRFAAAVLLPALLLPACGASPTGEEDPGPTDSPDRVLRIEPGSAEIEVQDVLRFEAYVVDREGNEVTGYELSWSSSDAWVASVAGGLVTGMGVGTADIAVAAAPPSGERDSLRAAASVTVRQRSGSVLEHPVCEATDGDCYYLANEPGSGSGTFEDPFGMADLPDPAEPDCEITGSALSSLGPGDYLYVREGVYEFETCPSDAYYKGYLRPPVPGTESSPITFRAYPEERVVLRTTGSQPALGDNGNAYVRYLGFTVEKSFVRMHGDGFEVAYLHIIGRRRPDFEDNHDGIRIENLSGGWVHHNIVQNVQGGGSNSAGLKLYETDHVVVEDNYIFDNTTGAYDKDTGRENTYRRNYFSGNSAGFYGNTQGQAATYYIYDNVSESPIELHFLGSGTEIHDNLVLSSSLAGAWAGEVYQTKIWNNVVVTDAEEVLAYRYPQEPYSDALLEYMDHNFYTAGPVYEFGQYASESQTFSLSGMRGRGYAQNSRVVPAEELFTDPSSYVISSAYGAAGRDGDLPGPQEPAAIMDVSRYGPQALPLP